VGEAQLTRLDGPSVELEIAKHLLVRGAKAAPLLVVASALVWGLDGAWSSAYGLALVAANFLVSAALLSTTARISLGLMMGAALFGYLLRLGLIFLAIWLVKDASWVELVPLGLTVIVTHLGLLFWEMRYISASLAFPGLKPGVPKES
jgi:hypothetical protein